MSNEFALIIIGLLTINAVLSYAILRALQGFARLSVKAQRWRPGYRRSGVVIPMPHVDYEEDNA